MIPSSTLMASAALLAAAAIVPVVVGLLAHRRALAPGRPADQAYFDWLQTSMWLFIGLWTLWPLAIEATGHPLERALWRSGFAVTAAGLSIACTVPLLLATLALAVLGQDVSRRLRGESVTAREGLTLVLLQIGSIASLIAGAATASFLILSHFVRAGVLAGVAGVAFAVILSTRHRRLSALELHAVTAGPLRDRLFALGAQAGVTLRQLFVVPMARRRIGNAFAVRGGVVILTDVLLAQLSHRELDAVMAHEIAHLKMGHPHKLALAFAVVLAPALVALSWVHHLEWIGPAVVVALFVRLWIGRRFEYAADAAAVKLCGDPEALISGLSRMSRINGLPNGWSRWRDWFITHPSTERRIARIAGDAHIAPDRVATLMADAPVADGYDVPLALAGAGKVFSSTLKRRIVQRLALVRLAVVVGVPAALFAFAGATLDRGTVFASALLTGFLLLLLIYERSAASAIARLERPLRARHANDATPEYVSLAPGNMHRVYEGFFEWDLGLLTVTPDRLEYRGEETSFALEPAQVTAIEVVRGPRAWIRSARVQITWTDGAGVERAFNLRPARVARVSRMRTAAQALATRLEAWRAGAGASSLAVPVSVGASVSAGLPPTIEAVSGDALARVTSPRAFFQAVPTLVIFSAVATLLAGLPLNPFRGPGWLDVFGAALGASMLAHLPYWLPARAPAARTTETRPAEAA